MAISGACWRLPRRSRGADAAPEAGRSGAENFTPAAVDEATRIATQGPLHYPSRPIPSAHRGESTMQVRAAVAHEAGKPLSVEMIDLEGPKAGEVLVELKATGICHTDEYTLSGKDPEGLFPSILGHEGAGVVVEVGAGVSSLAV